MMGELAAGDEHRCGGKNESAARHAILLDVSRHGLGRARVSGNVCVDQGRVIKLRERACTRDFKRKWNNGTTAAFRDERDKGTRTPRRRSCREATNRNTATS